MLTELLIATGTAIIVYIFYKWATKNNNYFKANGLKYMKPTFLVGNFASFLVGWYTGTGFSQMLYTQFPNERINGVFDFCKPAFLARDPEIIKQLVIKDFDHFENHAIFVDESTDQLFGNSLFLMKSQKWRDMRATLSPAFTGSKMRQMFELVSECADDMIKHLLKRVENRDKLNEEVKDLFSNYTSDVIASCAFGIKINSFENPNNEFSKAGKEVLQFAGIKTAIRLLILRIFPSIAKAFDLQLIEASVRKFFKSMVLNTIDERNRLNIFRPDIINTLMLLRHEKPHEQQANCESESTENNDGFATVEESDIGKMLVQREWSDDELVAQCFVFFIAGFETTSTMLTFTAYELIVNPDIQTKLFEEIRETNNSINGKRITYNTLQKMKYLDQVICECLRKWPPIAITERVCVKDYTYDDGANLKFQIKNGTGLIIPIYGLHHDSKYFPDPDKFDPERFNDENKKNIIPGSYIPFGIGPRNCIGSRFALMEIKAVLYYLLLHFSFEVNSQTEIPIKLKKTPLGVKIDKGLFLELQPRDGAGEITN